MNNKKFEIALLIEMFSFMKCCWLVIFDEMFKICLVAKLICCNDIMIVNNVVNSIALYFNIGNALSQAMNYTNDEILR